jgi:chromate transporter
LEVGGKDDIVRRVRVSTPQSAPAPFRTALAFWTELGFVSSGGPTGQIALMHGELVEKKRWIGEGQILHALNYCMLLPGPEAQQLAIYIGWLLHGARGGIAAGALFVPPSVFILLGLSWIYAAHGDVAWVAAIFSGLRPAVMAIVAQAVLRIGERALKKVALHLIAAAAFVGLLRWKWNAIGAVLACGAAGLAWRLTTA